MSAWPPVSEYLHHHFQNFGVLDIMCSFFSLIILCTHPTVVYTLERKYASLVENPTKNHTEVLRVV